MSWQLSTPWNITNTNFIQPRCSTCQKLISHRALSSRSSWSSDRTIRRPTHEAGQNTRTPPGGPPTIPAHLTDVKSPVLSIRRPETPVSPGTPPAKIFVLPSPTVQTPTNTSIKNSTRDFHFTLDLCSDGKFNSGIEISMRSKKDFVDQPPVIAPEKNKRARHQRRKESCRVFEKGKLSEFSILQGIGYIPVLVGSLSGV